MAFIRVGVDVAAWQRLNVAVQELLVGRAKLTGCPLMGLRGDGSTIPAEGCPQAGNDVSAPGNEAYREPRPVGNAQLLQSHVQRANHHVNAPPSDVGSLRIFRQGYEFLETTSTSPGIRVGLNFVSFQDSPERLTRLLTQPGWLGGINFGGDPQSQPAGMKDLLTVRAAGMYVVPPRDDTESFPGAGIFSAGVLA